MNKKFLLINMIFFVFITAVNPLKNILKHDISSKPNTSQNDSNQNGRNYHDDNNGDINTNYKGNGNDIINSAIARQEKYDAMRKDKVKVVINNDTEDDSNHHSILNYGYTISYNDYHDGKDNAATQDVDGSQKYGRITSDGGNSNIYYLGEDDPGADKGTSDNAYVSLSELFNIKIHIDRGPQPNIKVALDSKYKQLIEYQALMSAKKPGSLYYSIEAVGILTCPAIYLVQHWIDAKTGKDTSAKIGQFGVYNFYNTNGAWAITLSGLGSAVGLSFLSMVGLFSLSRIARAWNDMRDGNANLLVRIMARPDLFGWLYDKYVDWRGLRRAAGIRDGLADGDDIARVIALDGSNPHLNRIDGDDDNPLPPGPQDDQNHLPPDPPPQIPIGGSNQELAAINLDIYNISRDEIIDMANQGDQRIPDPNQRREDIIVSRIAQLNTMRRLQALVDGYDGLAEQYQTDTDLAINDLNQAKLEIEAASRRIYEQIQRDSEELDNLLNNVPGAAENNLTDEQNIQAQVQRDARCLELRNNIQECVRVYNDELMNSEQNLFHIKREFSIYGRDNNGEVINEGNGNNLDQGGQCRTKNGFVRLSQSIFDRKAAVTRQYNEAFNLKDEIFNNPENDWIKNDYANELTVLCRRMYERNYQLTLSDSERFENINNLTNNVFGSLKYNYVISEETGSIQEITNVGTDQIITEGIQWKARIYNEWLANTTSLILARDSYFAAKLNELEGDYNATKFQYTDSLKKLRLLNIERSNPTNRPAEEIERQINGGLNDEYQLIKFRYEMECLNRIRIISDSANNSGRAVNNSDTALDLLKGDILGMRNNIQARGIMSDEINNITQGLSPDNLGLAGPQFLQKERALMARINRYNQDAREVTNPDDELQQVTLLFQNMERKYLDGSPLREIIVKVDRAANEHRLIMEGENEIKGIEKDRDEAQRSHSPDGYRAMQRFDEHIRVIRNRIGLNFLEYSKLKNEIQAEIASVRQLRGDNQRLGDFIQEENDLINRITALKKSYILDIHFLEDNAGLPQCYHDETIIVGGRKIFKRQHYINVLNTKIEQINNFQRLILDIRNWNSGDLDYFVPNLTNIESVDQILKLKDADIALINAEVDRMSVDEIRHMAGQGGDRIPNPNTKKEELIRKRILEFLEMERFRDLVNDYKTSADQYNDITNQISQELAGAYDEIGHAVFNTNRIIRDNNEELKELLAGNNPDNLSPDEIQRKCDELRNNIQRLVNLYNNEIINSQQDAFQIERNFSVYDGEAVQDDNADADQLYQCRTKNGFINLRNQLLKESFQLSEKYVEMLILSEKLNKNPNFNWVKTTFENELNDLTNKINESSYDISMIDNLLFRKIIELSDGINDNFAIVYNINPDTGLVEINENVSEAFLLESLQWRTKLYEKLSGNVAFNIMQREQFMNNEIARLEEGLLGAQRNYTNCVRQLRILKLEKENPSGRSVDYVNTMIDELIKNEFEPARTILEETYIPRLYYLRASLEKSRVFNANSDRVLNSLRDEIFVKRDALQAANHVIDGEIATTLRNIPQGQIKSAEAASETWYNETHDKFNALLQRTRTESIEPDEKYDEIENIHGVLYENCIQPNALLKDFLHRTYRVKMISERISNSREILDRKFLQLQEAGALNDPVGQTFIKNEIIEMCKGLRLEVENYNQIKNETEQILLNVLRVRREDQDFTKIIASYDGMESKNKLVAARMSYTRDIQYIEELTQSGDEYFNEMLDSGVTRGRHYIDLLNTQIKNLDHYGILIETIARWDDSSFGFFRPDFDLEPARELMRRADILEQTF